MQAPKIEPPDLMGCRHILAEALGELGEPRAGELIDLLDRFVDSYRQLDAWKLKFNRTKSFLPCEPCFHADAPAVVISSTPVRVSIRRWKLPLVQANFPMSGQIRWVDGHNLIKVGSRSQVERWVAAMARCGQTPGQWSTAEMKLLIP